MIHKHKVIKKNYGIYLYVIVSKFELAISSAPASPVAPNAVTELAKKELVYAPCPSN